MDDTNETTEQAFDNFDALLANAVEACQAFIDIETGTKEIE
jgi:enamine deaminase RidA (YjgF/YER057c/UK114 family)